jgi:uncharacterized protein (TIGR03437 family)
MYHASLCKKTYQSIRRFPGIIALLALLLMASGSLLGQSLTITTNSLPNGILGLPYLTAQQGTVDVTVTGGVSPYSWYIGSGSQPTTGLPPGLQLNSNTGAITGTPSSVGNYKFYVNVSDSSEGFASKYLGIQVVPCTPTFAPANLPEGDVGLRYTSVQFTASGCPGPYTYTELPVDEFSPNLPPGLQLSSSGLLTGTPGNAGTFSFLLTATDPNQNVTQIQYNVIFNALPSIATSSPLPNGPVGVPYSQQIIATGGSPPYIFSMNNNPPGITITPSGVLNGTPTQAGTFKFNIGVTDSLRGQTVTPFQVTFVTATSQIQVAPLSLTFNGNMNGNPPPTQAIAVVPATGSTPPVNFHVVINGGQSNTPAPSWITVTPTSGVAPAGLVVTVDQASLAAGSYSAGIQVLDSSGFASDVAVTLNVASVAQQLTVAPTILNFAARSATPGNLTEVLAVSNSGAGSLSFTAASVNHSSWISSVTASASSTTRNAPVFVQVVVNTSGLQVGSYHDVLLLSSSAGNVQVPVSLFIAASGPILGVDTTGVLFRAIQGGGSTVKQTVQVLNLGDPSSTVNWTASLVSGSNFLNLVSSSGTATSTTPGTLSLALTPSATELTPGPYYAIVKITDSNSLNSPQYVSAVLDLEPSTSAPAPDLVPGGLFFTTVADGAEPAGQQVQVNTSSDVAVPFQVAVTTSDGGTWLSVTPNSGTASGNTAGSVTVSVNPTGLAAGIYSGEVNVSIGVLLESVNVTFVVQPINSSNAVSHFSPKVVGCSPSKLAITETGLANNFAAPAGWPATLIVQLNDDCATPVTSGSVVASFSNGDAALNLSGDSLGQYSTTWQPGKVNSELVITLNATSGSLQPATAKLYGGVASNQTPPPTASPGGTLNNLNPVVGAPLAPGTIAQVYGSGLATAAVSPGVLPLRTNFDNTFALVGQTQAPLYFLSSGQINIQIPYEAPATQQVPIILSVNNALTIPLLLNIVPAAPGVLSANDGPTPPSVQNGAHIIAQHSDGSLVSSASPAKPGEYLVMYLVGLGATNPSVASGAATPASPLHSTTLPVTVTIGSAPSTVLFAGLTPGFVGLYQVNFQVPTGATSGELVVDVTQNGVAANPTLLPVSN